MGKIIRGHRVIDPPVKAGPVPMSVNNNRPRPRRVTVSGAEKHDSNSKKEFKTKPSPLRNSFLPLDLFPPPSMDPPETAHVEFDIGDLGLTLDDSMFGEGENWMCSSEPWPSSSYDLTDVPSAFPPFDTPHTMESPLPMVTELPVEDDQPPASIRPRIAALPEEQPEDALLEKAGLLATSENEMSEGPMSKKIIVTDDVPHHPRVDDLRRLTL